MALALFILVVVPVWPYFPHCEVVPPGHRNAYIYDRMSDEYRHLLKEGFKALEVYYWDVGGIILIRAIPFLDGTELTRTSPYGPGPLFAQADAINNAALSAARALAKEGYLGSYNGKEINGKVYRIPPYVKALLDANPGEFNYQYCEVMRSIVTGKPPAPIADDKNEGQK